MARTRPPEPRRRRRPDRRAVPALPADQRRRPAPWRLAIRVLAIRGLAVLGLALVLAGLPAPPRPGGGEGG